MSWAFIDLLASSRTLKLVAFLSSGVFSPASHDSQGREQDERGYALPEEPDPYDGFFKGLRTLATTVGFILAVGVLATVLMGAYELVVWIWK